MPLDKPLNLDFECQLDRSPQTVPRKIPTPPQATPEVGHRSLVDRLEKLKKELCAKNKLLDTKNREISKIKIRNRQLSDTNNDLGARQKLLEEELGKAQAQVELIQELLLENNNTREKKPNEKAGKYE